MIYPSFSCYFCLLLVFVGSFIRLMSCSQESNLSCAEVYTKHRNILKEHTDRIYEALRRGEYEKLKNLCNELSEFLVLFEDEMNHTDGSSPEHSLSDLHNNFLKIIEEVKEYYYLWEEYNQVKTKTKSEESTQFSNDSFNDKSNFKIDAHFISLFIADAFAPLEYDGSNWPNTNKKFLNSLFATALPLLSSGISMNLIEGMEKSFKDIQFSIFSEINHQSDILDKIHNLDESKGFKDCKNSVLIHSGFMRHGILCEFMKIKLNDNNIPDEKGVFKLAVLIYNSGAWKRLSSERHIQYRLRCSPVQIFVSDWE